MLKEILCPLFNHDKITFHEGLNIVLGDDEAKNSIGKSTTLMVIDFVQGGDSFINDDAGAINALGHHYYNFCFVFGTQSYFFSRSTDKSDLVYVCDKDYARQSELSIENYRKMLKSFFKLDGLENSFRSIVSPFSRIWRKGGLEPDQPIISASKEPVEIAVSRLIDLFDRSTYIASEKKAIDEQKARKKVITNSMNAEIIPKINKTEYGLNTKMIAENLGRIEQLKQGFGGALNAYEALFDESLRSMQHRKNELMGVDAHPKLTIWGCGYFLGLIYVVKPRCSRYSIGLR